MSLSPQKEIMGAVFGLLISDPTLINLVGQDADGNYRIYTDVPKTAGFPRIYIATPILTDWGSHTFSGFDGKYDVRSWSENSSEAEVTDLMSRIYTLLHNADLGIGGFPTINHRCILHQVMPDPDGRTFQGIQRFSLLLGGN